MANVTVTFTITEFCLHTGISEEELNEIVTRLAEAIEKEGDVLTKTVNYNVDGKATSS